MKYNVNLVIKKLLIKYHDFSDIINNTEFIENNSIPTACTDGEKIFYNSDFMESLTKKQQLMVMAHEVCHIALDHINRSKNKNIELWNIATDAVINANLEKDGCELFNNCIQIKDALEYDSEELYEKLLEEYNKKKIEKEQQKQNENQQQQTENESKKQQTGNESKKQQTGNEGDEQQNQDESKNNNDCQSSSNVKKNIDDILNDVMNNKSATVQNHDSWNSKKENSKNCDDTKENQNSDKSDKNDISQNNTEFNNSSNDKNENDNKSNSAKNNKRSKNKKIKKKSKDKNQENNTNEKSNKNKANFENKNDKEIFQKNRDERLEKIKVEKEKLKQQLKEYSKGLTNVFGETNISEIGNYSQPIDWKRLLRESTTREVDWTLRNAEVEDGIVLSRLEEFPCSETEIVLDTSGSVSENLLRNFLRECKNILHNSKIWVGCFDTRFYGFEEIKTIEDIENFRFKGFGGTDFNAAVNAFSKRVDNRIIFTDGYAPMPDKKVKAIWLVYGDTNIRPQGGKVIHITPEMLNKLNRNVKKLKR